MVEARVRRLPGYTPMPEYDDGASEGGAFLWRLGDAFELWDEQGDALEDDEMQREIQSESKHAKRSEVCPYGDSQLSDDLLLSWLGFCCSNCNHCSW